MRLTHPLAAASALIVLIVAGSTQLSARSLPVSETIPPAALETREVVTNAAIDAALLGTSGNLRAFIGLPSALTSDTLLGPVLAGLAIDESGVYPLETTAPSGEPLVAVSLQAFPETRARKQGGYFVGSWPKSRLAATNPNYAAPAGYITVTPENRETAVSKRFRFRDFLTHDQQDVWPKVLVLRTPLLDKLELIGDSLERRGLPSRLHVMSGFRTPQYNEQGVGAKGGRASNSRHMYGDAADVFVDGDGDGRMDDLDRDGKVTVKDARVLFAVAEGIEAQYPQLVGGLSAYPANSAHGPFVHVDTRGNRARW